jgi:protein gp37
MNKQWSKQKRGIEWCDFTHNYFGGCYHKCEWTMPNGEVAICYAKVVAERVAMVAFPQGFEAHYFRGEKALAEPARKATAGYVFVDSMSDMFGHWVPDEQVHQVFASMRSASWHTFIALTKAPQMIRRYQGAIPENCWLLASSPPDSMWGKALSRQQQTRLLQVSLDVLGETKATNTGGLSCEPLSWDITPVLRDNPPVNWLIIGAASNGNRYYQPRLADVEALLTYADEFDIPVFFKGNLAWEPRREEHPVNKQSYPAAKVRYDNAIKYGWPINKYYLRYVAQHEGVQDGK